MKLQPLSNDPIKDLVYTPSELARQIIVHFNPIGRILDPSKGHGAFFDAFPPGIIVYRNELLWCEIDRGRDFFLFNERVDWIITNPPWSKFRKFLAHSMEIATNIVFLITVNHIFTKARIRDIRAANFGIKEIYLLDAPKSFPQSGFQVGACHFQKDYHGSTLIQ